MKSATVNQSRDLRDLCRQETPFVRAASHIVFAKALEDLSQIQKPEHNLAIFKRKPKRAIVQFLSKFKRKRLHVRQTLAPASVAAALRSELARFEDCDGKRDLIDDIDALANFFARLTNANRLHLHLDVIRTDQCKKFHCDFYPLRLLCSYVGKGTEYLENDNANRDGETNDEIVRDWRKVKRLNPFDVAILKGEFEGNVGNGIMHRSPPIEAEGGYRILLRIDA